MRYYHVHVLMRDVRVRVYNSQELLSSLGLCPEHRPSSQCSVPASRLGVGSEDTRREGGREGGREEGREEGRKGGRKGGR